MEEIDSQIHDLMVLGREMSSYPTGDEFLDAVEERLARIAEEFPVDLPVEHIFTPGLYCRKIFMPAGAMGTSNIHKTEHQFVILSGRLSVWTEREGMIHYQAPFLGITKPGTRRLLYIHEDTVWATFHATDKTEPEEIMSEITYARPSTQLLLK